MSANDLREKGNDAFKSNDYNKAIEFYSNGKLSIGNPKLP